MIRHQHAFYVYYFYGPHPSKEFSIEKFSKFKKILAHAYFLDFP
jgi:hypothetical protein